jgi:hypothetical protein
MKKFNNPFANPFAFGQEMKSGPWQDPDILRRTLEMHGNRGGAQRVPQRTEYQGTQRPQANRGQRCGSSTGSPVTARSGTANTDGHRFGMVNTNMFRPGSAHLDIPPPAAGHIGSAYAGTPQADPAHAGMPVHDGNTLHQDPGYGMQQINPPPAQNIRDGASVREPGRGRSGLQPKQQIAGNKAGSNMAGAAIMDFSAENLMRGFIMSEVLGRPKSLRRGRW